MRVPEPVLQPVAFEPVAFEPVAFEPVAFEPVARIGDRGLNPRTPDTLTPSLSRRERGEGRGLSP